MTVVRIGPATLYHADNRSVFPTLANDSAGVVLTDPPYPRESA
jgi:hypothetical protein